MTDFRGAEMQAEEHKARLKAKDARINALEGKLARLVEALKRVSTRRTSWNVDKCVGCDTRVNRPHAENCWVDEALSESEVDAVGFVEGARIEGRIKLLQELIVDEEHHLFLVIPADHIRLDDARAREVVMLQASLNRFKKLLEETDKSRQKDTEGTS